MTVESTNKKGGALLNVIYKYMMNSSDRTVKELFSFLLEKAAQPYLDVLQKWIYYGVLEDPFEEFLVKENKHVSK